VLIATSRATVPICVSSHEHVRADFHGDLRDPVDWQAGASGVLEHRLSIGGVVFAVDLSLSLRDVTLDPHDAGQRRNRLVRPPPGFRELLGRHRRNVALDDGTWHGTPPEPYLPGSRRLSNVSAPDGHRATCLLTASASAPLRSIHGVRSI